MNGAGWLSGCEKNRTRNRRNQPAIILVLPFAIVG